MIVVPVASKTAEMVLIVIVPVAAPGTDCTAMRSVAATVSEPDESVNAPVALLPGDTDCPPLTALSRVLIVDVAAILLAVSLTKNCERVPAVRNMMLLVASVVDGDEVLPAIARYWVVLAVEIAAFALAPTRVFAIHLALYQNHFTRAKPGV